MKGRRPARVAAAAVGGGALGILSLVLIVLSAGGRLRGGTNRRAAIGSAAVVLLGTLLGYSDVGAQTDGGTRRGDPSGLIQVSGVVLDERTGQPLRGAQVVAVGRSIGAVTDAEGRYVIAGLPNQNQAIRVTLPGYVPETREIWVCTPVLYPGGLCTPSRAATYQLSFYMRIAPTPRVR